MSRNDPDLDRVNRAVEVLREHFDTVQIFATREEPVDGGTINIATGQGNWFARLGQVDHWLMKQRERDKERERVDIRREAREGD